MPKLTINGRTLEAKAILFDKDGTLVDFHALWPRMTPARIAGVASTYAFTEAEERELALWLGMSRSTPGRVDPRGPLPLSPPDVQQVILAEFLYLRRDVKFDEARGLALAAFESSWGRLSGDDLRLLPDVKKTLRALHARGWRIGLVTNDSPSETKFVLGQLGIRTQIDAISAGGRLVERKGEAVQLAKPDAEMVTTLCAELGVPVAESVLIGDGHNDLKMGKGAGCLATIGVTSGCDERERLLAAGPDLILGSVAELLTLLPRPTIRLARGPAVKRQLLLPVDRRFSRGSWRGWMPTEATAGSAGCWSGWRRCARRGSSKTEQGVDAASPDGGPCDRAFLGARSQGHPGAGYLCSRGGATEASHRRVGAPSPAA